MSEREEMEPLPEELDALVGAMRADTIDPAMLEEITRRVLAAQAAGGSSSGGSDGTSGNTASSSAGSPPPVAQPPGAPVFPAAAVTAAAGTAVALAALLGLSWLAGGAEPSSVLPPLPSAVPAPASPAVVDEIAVPEPPRLEAPSPAGSLVTSEPTTPPGPPATAIEPATERGAETTRAPAAATPSEYELLGEARRVLGSDPARALELAEAHRRAYRNGALAPEREMIAIDALGALGRASAARQRAQRLVASWPDSAYAERVRASGLVE